jgi:hypothetical protein
MVCLYLFLLLSNSHFHKDINLESSKMSKHGFTWGKVGAGVNFEMAISTL